MLVNVVLALVPNVVIALRQTITIKANITAYSTAVGPSSDTMKRRNFNARFFMPISPTAANPSVPRTGDEFAE